MVLKRTILVTRPEPGLAESVSELENRGWDAIACPSLIIHHNQPFSNIDCDALLITSAQSLPALAMQSRDQFLLTVGEKTAFKARQQGFRNVCSARGNALSLIQLCKEKGLIGKKLILACGQGWRGQNYGDSLTESLQAQAIIAYKVERATFMPLKAQLALKEQKVAAILFYSAETLSAFMNLCPKELHETLKNVRAICYSKAIADKAAFYASWAAIEVATYPSIQS
ncbi:uroporphyrinogen-III synthase [Aristophania vespae]|uniref:uroporphyrinogen-III synthase n=1 Tax=Aristophania vespae TaxID=2697033 RepID=UPI0023514F70|nr:uroporphyrinogen-III synthase [Aristophania vespae]UMM64661.1 hypothetical protein DM15PD_16780 [Aristophania vespae]